MEESETPTGNAVLRQLPLHEEHVAAGARFSPFAGW